eukprot:9352438-Pyramimonas_sp.AAC.1
MYPRWPRTQLITAVSRRGVTHAHARINAYSPADGGPPQAHPYRPMEHTWLCITNICPGVARSGWVEDKLGLLTLNMRALESPSPQIPR